MHFTLGQWSESWPPSLIPNFLFHCFSLFLPHLRTLAHEKRSENCLRFATSGASLYLYPLLKRNITFSSREKKILAKSFAHAISEHHRDFEHAYVYWIWLCGSASRLCYNKVWDLVIFYWFVLSMRMQVTLDWPPGLSFRQPLHGAGRKESSGTGLRSSGTDIPWPLKHFKLSLLFILVFLITLVEDGKSWSLRARPHDPVIIPCMIMRFCDETKESWIFSEKKWKRSASLTVASSLHRDSVATFPSDLKKKNKQI